MTGTPNLDLLDNPPWMRDGLCRTHPDPNLWFPTDGQPATQARAICRTCPVREQCADWATIHAVVHGIWGDTNWPERAAERKRLGITRKPRPPQQKPRTPPPDPDRMPPIPDGLDTLPTIDHRVALLTRRGFTAAQAASVLGRSTRAITRARARLRRGEPPARHPGPRTDDFDAHVAELRAAGHPVQWIANQLGCSRSRIWKATKRHHARQQEPAA